jgi:hypothetical protein
VTVYEGKLNFLENEKDSLNLKIKDLETGVEEKSKHIEELTQASEASTHRN